MNCTQFREGFGKGLASMGPIFAVLEPPGPVPGWGVGWETGVDPRNQSPSKGIGWVGAAGVWTIPQRGGGNIKKHLVNSLNFKIIKKRLL